MADLTININQGQVVSYITSTLQTSQFARASNVQSGSYVDFYPLKIEISQNKRITKKDNLEGSVIQHFNNRFNNNNDLVELTITCSTGNIDGTVTGNFTEDSARLDNLEKFYRIMSLAEEPTYIAGNEFNYVEIGFQTPVIRSPTILYGFFKEMPKIEESGENQKFIEFDMNFWIVNRSRMEFREFLNAISSARATLARGSSE